MGHVQYVSLTSDWYTVCLQYKLVYPIPIIQKPDNQIYTEIPQINIFFLWPFIYLSD